MNIARSMPGSMIRRLRPIAEAGVLTQPCECADEWEHPNECIFEERRDSHCDAPNLIIGRGQLKGLGMARRDKTRVLIARSK